MALLGDLAVVRQMIRADASWASSADTDARLTLIQKAVTAALEEKCGRTWGSPVADTSHLLWVGAGDALVLPRPARTITSITVGGTVVGNTMTGGTTYLPATLQNVITDEDGLVYAVAANATGNTGWWGTAYWSTVYRGYDAQYPVLVVGDFGDSDAGTVIPDDVTYAACYLITSQLKIENASPAGFVGPDGATVPVTNPWKSPLVMAVVDKYAVRQKIRAV